MGKGDKRTKRGKIFSGSYGRYRLKKKRHKVVPQEQQQQPVVEQEQPASENVSQE